MSEKTVFKRIIDGEIPADLVHEDEYCLAFHDISPKAPTHILVIPKKEIPSVAEIEDEDADLESKDAPHSTHAVMNKNDNSIGEYHNDPYMDNDYDEYAVNSNAIHRGVDR